ncbi:MAG: TSUP family transporter, partial [Nitrospiraceae bacterium]
MFFSELTVGGFGIGSLLTPLLALTANTKLAVAAVAIPHLVGAALRLWRLRAHIDRRVLWSFGMMSAMGGLAGALLHAWIEASVLRVVFGLLLMLAGVLGLTGLSDRIRFRGPAAWAAGFVSGALGGLVGTQGGIRAAALFGFEMSKESFVATATAVALIVDGMRAPVYLISQWSGLTAMWPLIVLGTTGVLVGTLAGERVLR